MYYRILTELPEKNEIAVYAKKGDRGFGVKDKQRQLFYVKVKTKNSN